MLEEFKDRLNELSEKEIAFLAEIYDRMLDDHEVFLTLDVFHLSKLNFV